MFSSLVQTTNNFCWFGFWRIRNLSENVHSKIAFGFNDLYNIGKRSHPKYENKSIVFNFSRRVIIFQAILHCWTNELHLWVFAFIFLFERDKPKFEQLSVLFDHFVDRHQMKGYVMCCNVKLIKPRAMALHMARHLQPNAFKCPECNKMLTCPKILQYHMQNHLPEAERPLACAQCPRRFSYSSALVAHAISHQPVDQRVAHICDECGKV